ncbi:MAG: glutaminyl-peptide cyclotransferase [Vicinamibacterales bacterium]
MRVLIPLLAFVALSQAGPVSGPVAAQSRTGSVPVLRYTVVHTYPHDPNAFTQGLEYVDGVFYEGTGLNGRSSIRKVQIDTGKVLQQRELPEQHFGEGITLWKGELFQLTWLSGLALVYDAQTFTSRRTHRYSGEGWGLTHDDAGLVMSDGTADLRFLNPATFVERRRVHVSAGGTPLKDLNELEYVRGEVLANVWQTDYVARIDPASGRVNSYIDFRGLLTPRERERTDVLNGIAYDAAGDRLFVTGKLWPKVFEVRITR